MSGDKKKFSLIDITTDTVLWDTKDKDYLNKLVRNYTWNDVANRTEKMEDDICTVYPLSRIKRGRCFKM